MVADKISVFPADKNSFYKKNEECAMVCLQPLNKKATSSDDVAFNQEEN